MCIYIRQHAEKAQKKKNAVYDAVYRDVCVGVQKMKTKIKARRDVAKDEERDVSYRDGR